MAIGDAAVAPSDPNILWVGTGEHNPRNSVSYGDGIYKSTDGGETWKNMGLAETRHIGRIAIHPRDPDIVYVGAMGRTWGRNEERGLYKTTDGGETWEKVLYVDDQTGVIEVQMNPNEPDTLLVATYQRQRDIYDSGEPAVSDGPGSGVWKTTDGGETFRRLTEGLPEDDMGRTGIDYYDGDPDIVYLITGGARANRRENGTYRSDDGGESWKRVSSEAQRPMYYSQIRVDPTDPDTVFAMGVRLRKSTDGGESFENVGRGTHVDHHALWIDPDDNSHVLLGNDGGLYESNDGGARFSALKKMALGQFYDVAVDTRRDYAVSGGLQDNGTYYGPHMKRGSRGPTNRDFYSIGGGDGFVVQIDPTDPTRVFLESQNGNIRRTTIRPRGRRSGRNETSTREGRSSTETSQSTSSQDEHSGDDDCGSQMQDTAENNGSSQDQQQSQQRSQQRNQQNRSQNRQRRRRGLKPSAPEGERARWAWKTDFILSPHNPRIYYLAGNFVYKSSNYAEDLRPISPRISLTNSGAGTAITNSPLNPDVIYAGTDDGGLWVTRDGGFSWKAVHENTGVPVACYVSTLEASRYSEGRCYVAFDGHRSNDERPFIYVTEDFGETWQPLTDDLPEFGSTRCLREDTVNPDLLYAGTEFGAFVSLNRGEDWAKLGDRLPSVAVHDFAINDAAAEIVAATHGRSFWILDIAWLRQANADVANSDAHLFEPNPAVLWQSPSSPGREPRTGEFVGENPPFGAVIYYMLKSPADRVAVRILDSDGQVIRQLRGEGSAGVNQVIWDLKDPRGGAEELVWPGEFHVEVIVDNKKLETTLEVHPDPATERN
ncbi:MAG: hypothetical protein MPJ50_09715 [Pirellulales bacterium]|nr:hypothetical protein [Pirellulales bacterium]